MSAKYMLLRGRMLMHALSIGFPVCRQRAVVLRDPGGPLFLLWCLQWLHTTSRILRHPVRTQQTRVTIEDYKGPFVAVGFTKPLLCHYGTPAIMR
jgi:hypothetical protein